ncbi:unnamed protein product [Cylindrotheca closterium]|uniref:Spore protein YkvP/CgeB glycosyl transferase-like domain-containing protein n=1 Tax=Cylindrotheca closterium TaxID=2856 RepID=A0AAD2GAY3_9STRA|nr:unnamed protein product [Cylindrotheca closterium]
MTPNMHRHVMADPTILTTNNSSIMLSHNNDDHHHHHHHNNKEHHQTEHPNTRKRKSAKCHFFANPIKLGVYLGFGIYALLQGLQQVLVHHHSSSHPHTSSGAGLLNLPFLLFGGGGGIGVPNYDVISIMEASKKQFTTNHHHHQDTAEHQKPAGTSTAGNHPNGIRRLLPNTMTDPPPTIASAKQVDTTATKAAPSMTSPNSTTEAPPETKLSSKDQTEKTKTAKFLPLTTTKTTTSPKLLSKESSNANKIQATAHATATQRKERPVESKSPMATREDWQKVMREQPLYPKNYIPSTPLKVGLITANGIKGPTQHVFVDGIHGSDYLSLQVLCDVGEHNCTSALDYPDIDLWMVDANSAKSKPFPNDIVHQLVAIDDNPSFRIFFVDYSDRLVLRKAWMDSVYFDIDEDRMLAPHIRYGLRCIDKYRRWAKAKGYINAGRIVHPMWDEMLITQGGPPLHAPFAVRTDIADSIHNLLPSIAQGPNDKNTTTTTTTGSSGASCSPLPYHPVDCIPDRPMDLIHLWKVIETNNGLLRNLATESVEQMRTWKHPTENRTLRVETAIQGNRAHAGRQSVSDDYVRTLLQTKIVVVTQRDGWEDHFRLFEALAAGTMVLMDEMVSLPHSLEDGESVVFFHSIQEMHDKALYYIEHTEERLAIARKGWEVTMEKHRSWHRLEEMLFGKGLTKPTLNESWHFDR